MTTKSPMESMEAVAKTLGKQPATEQPTEVATPSVEAKPEETPAAQAKTEETPSDTTAVVNQPAEEPEEVDSTLEDFLNAEFGEETPAESDTEIIVGSQQKPEEKATEPQKQEDAVNDLINSEPLIAWALQLKAQGKDARAELEAIFKEDPNNLSEQALFERMLAAEGINGEDATEELERFKDKSIFEQKTLVKSFRQELINERESKMKLLKPEPVVDNSAEIIEAAKNRLTQLCTEREDQFFDGMKLSKENNKAISDYVMTKAPQIRKPDGTFDVDAMYEFAAWKLYKKEIIKSNITKYVTQAKLEVIKGRTNPSGGSSVQKGFVNGSGNTLDDAIKAGHPGLRN